MRYLVCLDHNVPTFLRCQPCLVIFQKTLKRNFLSDLQVNADLIPIYTCCLPLKNTTQLSVLSYNVNLPRH